MANKLIKLLIYIIIPWIIMVPIWVLDNLLGVRYTPVMQLFCVLTDGCIVIFCIIWVIVKKIEGLQ